MGAYLSRPNVEKCSSDGESKFLQHASCAMQGWRVDMEDAHLCMPSFDGDQCSLFGVFDGHGGASVAQYCAQKFSHYFKEQLNKSGKNYSKALIDTFMAIDTDLTTENVIRELRILTGSQDSDDDNSDEIDEELEGLEEDNKVSVAALREKYQDVICDANSVKNGEVTTGDVEAAPTSTGGREISDSKPANERQSALKLLKKLVRKSEAPKHTASEGDDTDSEWEDCDDDDDSDEDVDIPVNPDDDSVPGVGSGTTAVVAYVKDDTIYVANSGDSRCVICIAGKAVDLSEDHKPEDELEMRRIKKAGGDVTPDGRVNGGLNLSRALGDHFYKQNSKLALEEQMISAMPDVVSRKLDKDSDFMIIACDGIWNVMSSQEVIDFVSNLLKTDKKLSVILEELFDRCIAEDTSGDGTGCDNMTAILVKFVNKKRQYSSNGSVTDNKKLKISHSD